MARRERLQNIQPINSNFVSPIIYEGYSIDPQEENVGILANRIDKFDQNVREANKQITTLDIALGDIGTKLNNKEQQWFDEYKENLRNKINEQITLGNYQGAINVATRLAGDVASDAQLNAKIKYNEDLQKWVDNINSRQDLSSNKKAWAIHKYGQYDYKDVTDNNDKIIGGTEFNRNSTVEASINWDQEWALTDRLVAEESYTRGGTKFTDDKSMSTTTDNSYKRKTAEKLRNAMKERMNNPQFAKQLREELASELYNYEQLTGAEKQNAAKSLMYNDAIIGKDDYEHYIELKLKQQYPEFMSYNNKIDTSEQHYYGSITPSNGVYTGGKQPVYPYFNADVHPDGTVEYKVGIEANPAAATSAGSSVSSLGESGF